MKRKCCVKNCPNKSYNTKSSENSNIKPSTWHNWPSRENISKKWMEQFQLHGNVTGFMAKTPINTEYSYICGAHFEKEQFTLTKNGVYRLNKDAVPTIFPAAQVNSYSGSDHTYGKTVIESGNGQQQKEVQPNQIQATDQDDDVIVLLNTTEAKRARVNPPVTSPAITHPTTKPRAPYDLTDRMIEEPKKAEPIKRILVSKPPVTLPVLASASNQQPVAGGPTVGLMQPASITQQPNKASQLLAFAMQFNNIGNIIDLNTDAVPSKRPRVDSPLVTPQATTHPLPITKPPYDLTGRMMEPQKAMPVNRIPFPNPVIPFPMATPANNQGLRLIFVPNPITTFAIPAQNINYCQVPQPLVVPSVIPSNAVIQNGQAERPPEGNIVECNPGPSQPNKKVRSEKVNERRDKVLNSQRNLVRKLKRRVEQMEKAHAKLVDTVGFSVYERCKKDIRVKRLFRAIEAILEGDDNGEDHPAFLIDQILNFNAKTPAQAKYSQATMRSSTALLAKSASTYDFIRNQGVIILPCRQSVRASFKKDSVAKETNGLEDEDVSQQSPA